MTCGFPASSIFSTSHSHFRLRSTRTDVVTGIYISVGLLSTEVYSPISEHPLHSVHQQNGRLHCSQHSERSSDRETSETEDNG